MRALAPFIAGTSKMPYSNFAPYSIIGTGLWATTFILIGYFASQSLDKVAEIVGRGLIYFGFFVGLVVAIVAHRPLSDVSSATATTSSPRWRSAARSARCWQPAGASSRRRSSSTGGSPPAGWGSS